MRVIHEKAGKVTCKTAWRDYFKGYFDFMGQTTRAGYWWMMPILVIVWFLPFFCLLFAQVAKLKIQMSGALVLYIIMVGLLALGTFIPTLALSVRRCRDAGLNGRGAVVLWLLNGFASRFTTGTQAHAWTLISAIIGLTLFSMTLLKTNAVTTKSDNPLVKFFLRQRAA
ncbi:DUF805 domain-containing protein [Latilactobacillus graminis]|uniref:DUF805 domain-containing protein n=2 Tax=Latilactobacillus graminis TaxID=60519 RepID=A0AA89I0G0_9LACO|nr:DUF805 domain-containing protein [Latilactobacillus graminis]KRM21048.1 hypothetical protein FC90_GL001583 [Latilactobacillus graminis DSM 20719]QFP79182.1 DUF805 domain-containing protein [Latilactobacillus graminis]